ncbi:hypothetical protein HNR68_000650 [Saccharopolyspora hordei]|uniref:Uncharacterized protein n=1 Tax=Saccharopolyspora hordei TaxID=1838 RepID=A0A853ANZ4_9PSEU|nr:hypothetical protein [Saccharopolyspora hordei]
MGLLTPRHPRTAVGGLARRGRCAAPAADGRTFLLTPLRAGHPVWQKALDARPQGLGPSDGTEGPCGAPRADGRPEGSHRRARAPFCRPPPLSRTPSSRKVPSAAGPGRRPHGRFGAPVPAPITTFRRRTTAIRARGAPRDAGPRRDRRWSSPHPGGRGRRQPGSCPQSRHPQGRPGVFPSPSTSCAQAGPPCPQPERRLTTDLSQIRSQPDRWICPEPQGMGTTRGSNWGWICGQLGIVVDRRERGRSCPPPGRRSPRSHPVVIHIAPRRTTSANAVHPHNSQPLLLLRSSFLGREKEKRSRGRWRSGQLRSAGRSPPTD